MSNKKYDPLDKFKTLEEHIIEERAPKVKKDRTLNYPPGKKRWFEYTKEEKAKIIKERMASDALPPGKTWHDYTKEERAEIIAKRRERDGLPPGKKVYKTTPPKLKNTAMQPKDVAIKLAKITGCSRAEASYWFAAVSALLEHELLHERQFKFPHVLALYPTKSHNKKFFHFATQTWCVTPEWVKYNVKYEKTFKDRLRETYPFRPIDISHISIEDLC